jgi:hypothetical protein
MENSWKRRCKEEISQVSTSIHFSIEGSTPLVKERINGY